MTGQKVLRALGLTTMIVAAIAAQASAGLKLTLSNAAGGTTSLIAQDGRLSEISSVNGVLLDCKRDQLTIWDTKKRMYWQGTSAEAEAGLKTMMAGLQKQMAAFQSMTAGGGTSKVTATSLGTRTFAGYKAVGYEVSGSGPMAMAKLQSWYSSDLEQQIERETGKCEAFATLAGMGAAALGDDARQLTAQLAKEHGYVVSQSMSMMGRSNVISKLQKVESVDAPASAFAVPDGFTRVKTYGDYLKQEGM